MSAPHHALAARRWRIAIALTMAVVVLYFGFILLIAYRTALMGSSVTPGLRRGTGFSLARRSSS